ncbi:MAG: MFS transporter [Streptosporangiales bacterium]|nr:MFS transporter [Streptosporangiales bacterium]
MPSSDRGDHHGRNFASLACQTPPRPKSTWCLLRRLIGWIFDYYEVFLLTFLLIPISKAFGLSAGQSAWLISASLASIAVGGVGFGLVADRIGRQRVLIITVLVYSLATLARAASPNYETLMILTLIAGLGLGGEYGVGQSLITEVLNPLRRGWWSGLLYGGAFVAIMLASLVGGHLLPLVGWRWTFAISGLPVLFALYLRMRTPESAAWERAVRHDRVSWRAFASKSFIRPFFICLIAASFYFWAYYGATTLLPKYLVEGGFSMSGASWWIFFTAFAGLLGCVTGAWASDRFGRRITLTALMTIATVGALVLFILGRELLTSPAILVPFFVMYFGSNAATVFGALFSEVFPTETRSTGVSSALQIARGLSAIPPLIAAAVVAEHGYAWMFLGSTVLYAAAALWAWVFPETRGLDIDTVDARALRTEA